jgi:hypothetical protein
LYNESLQYRHGIKHLIYDGPLRAEDIFTWTTKVIHPPSRPAECDYLLKHDDPISRAVIFYGATDSDEYLNAFTDVVLIIFFKLHSH